jgi:hypothetical protein
MPKDRPQNSIPREGAISPEEEEQIRAHFRGKHSLKELLASGEISQETYDHARRLKDQGPPTDSMRPIVAELRAERERQGLSLSDVAERSGIDRAAIHKLEIGLNKNPTIGTLERYAGALGRQVNLSLNTVPVVNEKPPRRLIVRPQRDNVG